MPAEKTLVRNLIGDEGAAKLDNVSLSNDTVKRRIQEMSGDIADQVIAGVKDSKFGFAIQLDESTDVAKCSQLLVYVRFIQNNTVASYSICDVLYWQHNIATQRDYAMRTCALFRNITS